MDLLLKTATIVCDPMSSKTSVQYGLVNLVVKTLKGFDRIRIVSPFIPANRIESLEKIANAGVWSVSKKKRFLNFIYRILEGNESMLWSFSWLMEATYGANSSLYDRNIHKQEENVIINISYTMPLKCKMLWNQASPPADTLVQMGKANPFAKVIVKLFGSIIKKLDEKIQKRHFAQSEIFVHNSEYLKETYRKLNYPSGQVIYVPREFPLSPLAQELPLRDYVLAYIGKETEIDTLMEMARRGVKIISFGAKIPFGTPMSKIKQTMDFRGYVTDEELGKLYSNALFTAFPFTDEPFGWVPLESMFYGTPVLSYSKQGPAETILNGSTGWLVGSSREFIDKAVELWNSGNTGVTRSACRKRAEHFSFSKTEEQLDRILMGYPDA